MLPAQRRLHRQQDAFITYGLNRLSFRYIEREHVGFQQLVDTLARYEQYRQAGLGHQDALECVRYGDGWLCLPAAEARTNGLAGHL